MIYPTFGKLHTGKFSERRGPSWPRTLLMAFVASLTLGIFLQYSSKDAQNVAGKVTTAPAVDPWTAAYGSKDPYGFGPRAHAGPGTPGGAANQESLSSESPSEQPEASDAKADKN